MHFTSVSAAVDYLIKETKTRTVYTLEPTRRLLDAIGAPDKKLPLTIHIAGTNGKGSTSAFIRAILEAANYKVSVYTSPHLIHFNERFLINGKWISDEKMLSCINDILKTDEAKHASYFEISTALAFLSMADANSDVVIIETGLGGETDSTNAMTKKDVSIITSISFDHMEFLGNTLTSIAKAKAGIFKQNVPAIIGYQPSEAKDVLTTAAQQINAPAFVGGKDWTITKQGDGLIYKNKTAELHLPLPHLQGDHQMYNAGLAITAVLQLPLTITETHIKQGLQTAHWAGRFHQIKSGSLINLLPEDFELWIDCAHNEDGMRAFVASLKKLSPKPLYILFGLSQPRDAKKLLNFLTPLTKHIIACPIPEVAKTYTPQEIQTQAASANIKIATAASVHEAIDSLRSLPPGRIFACGSLYFAGHVLKENGGFHENDF